MYKVTLAPEKMIDALTLRALLKVLVDSYAREAGYARGSVRLIGVLKFHTHCFLFSAQNSEVFRARGPLGHTLTLGAWSGQARSSILFNILLLWCLQTRRKAPCFLPAQNVEPVLRGYLYPRSEDICILLLWSTPRQSAPPVPAASSSTDTSAPAGRECPWQRPVAAPAQGAGPTRPTREPQRSTWRPLKQ